MLKIFKHLFIFGIIFSSQLISHVGSCQALADLINKLSLVEEKHVDTSHVLATNELTEKYLYSNPDSAILFGNISVELTKKLDLNTEKARAYNNLAKIYYVTGSFFESLTYADSAFELSKKLQIREGLASAINTKGLIYLGQDKMKEAIVAFKKSLVYNLQLKDSSRIAVNYFNIGLAYDESAEFNTAFLYLNKALKISQECKDMRLSQMSLNRMAEVHFHTKNYQQALILYRSVLNDEAFQDDWERCFAFSGVAQTMYELGQYQDAIENANKSFELSYKLKAKWDIERATSILSKCYAALGRYSQAYEYEVLSRTYGDSISNEKIEKELNYLQLQEEKAQNIQLTKENEYNKEVINKNRIVIMLTCAFSLVLVILIVLLRRNIIQKDTLNIALQNSNTEINQQKEEIQAQREALLTINSTKDRVLSVISHDLRSPFTSILQLLDLMEDGELDPQSQKAILEDFRKQIDSVAKLTDNLLHWANSQQNGTTVAYKKVDVVATCGSIISLYSAALAQKKLLLDHTFKEPIYINADENHVRIILQNIINNAIKFTKQQGTISIFYTKTQNFVAVHIKDSGRGMSEKKLSQLFNDSGQGISEPGTNNELGTGLGLLLIKQFIEENNGHIEVRSKVGEGSEFIIQFKAYKTSELIAAI